eukprot:g1488.t1
MEDRPPGRPPSSDCDRPAPTADGWKMPVYLRARPPRDPEAAVSFTMQEGFDANEGRQRRRPGVNVDGIQFEATFDDVFGMHVSQADIFNAAVRPIVDASMCGYNATVFAYGQTGAGKTYSLTGGQQYSERGIIPRTIERVFRSQNLIRVCVSYVEIYQESCYDLLDHSHSVVPIEEWKRVHVMQNGHGEVQMQGLGVYETETERDAMNLLFTGNIHRMTSETPMNQASSRSHSIFTLSIETRGSEGGGAADDGVDSSGKHVVYRSKLHLVDLAGSERQMSMRRHRRGLHHRFASTGRMVGRSLIGGGGGGAGELTPTTSPSSPTRHKISSSSLNNSSVDWSLLDSEQKQEGKAINLSLHYLEHVIRCLQERSASTSVISSPSGDNKRNKRTNNLHIPYRNSLLTTILRNSLGGNCRTAFIVNINPELEFVEETLATCKFAQRLSSIERVAVKRNKEINIRALVKKLEAENARLNEAIEKSRGGSASTAVSAPRSIGPIEMGQLRSAADTFLAPDDPEPNFSLYDVAQAHAFIHLVRDRFCRVSTLLDESLDRERVGQEKLKKIQSAVKRAEDSLLQLRHDYLQRQKHEGSDGTASHTRSPTKSGEDETLVNSEAAIDRTSGATSATEIVTDPGALTRKRRRVASQDMPHEQKTEPATATASSLQLVHPSLSSVVAKRSEDGGGSFDEGRAGQEEKDKSEGAMGSTRKDSEGLRLESRDGEGGGNPEFLPSIEDTGSGAEDQFFESLSSPSTLKVSMVQGGVFLKHGRRGKAHPRFVWVSPADGCIKWRKLGAIETPKSTRTMVRIART